MQGNNTSTNVFIALVTSIFFVVMIKFCWMDNPIPLSEKVMQLSYEILIAIVVSCIFYFIVIDLEKKRKSKIINGFIRHSLIPLVNRYYNTLEDSGFNAKEVLKHKDLVSLDDFNNITSKVQLHAKFSPKAYVKYMNVNANFLEYIQTRRNEEKLVIDKILKYQVENIDSELLKILSKLENDVMDSIIYVNKIGIFKGINVSDLGVAYYNYLKTNHELYWYYHLKLKA